MVKGPSFTLGGRGGKELGTVLRMGFVLASGEQVAINWLKDWEVVQAQEGEFAKTLRRRSIISLSLS